MSTENVKDFGTEQRNTRAALEKLMDIFLWKVPAMQEKIIWRIQNIADYKDATDDENEEKEEEEAAIPDEDEKLEAIISKILLTIFINIYIPIIDDDYVQYGVKVMQEIKERLADIDQRLANIFAEAQAKCFDEQPPVDVSGTSSRTLFLLKCAVIKRWMEMC
jgi:hypothetical protein